MNPTKIKCKKSVNDLANKSQFDVGHSTIMSDHHSFADNVFVFKIQRKN